MSLQSLYVRAGDQPSASRRDALIRHLRRQMFTGVTFTDGPVIPFAHPWRITADRFTPPEGGKATLTADAAWRLDIRAGTINDEIPTLLYRRENDPRGWTPGDDFAMPVKGDKDYDPTFIERDLLDDLDDPPFLALKDPPRIQPATDADKLSRDFSLVPDENRPDVFMGAADWEKELWVAHVLLSATPLTVGIFEPAAPPRLKRYRLYSVPRLPTAAFGALAGGWLELATIYLLRDPQSMEDVEVRIRQREWWPLWSIIVTPGADILASVTSQPIDLVTGLPFADAAVAGANEANALLADMARAQIAGILEGASSVEWWTV